MISFAGSVGVYREPRSAMNWTTWLPDVHPRSDVQAPSESAPPADEKPCESTSVPHSDSLVASVQFASPTPSPVLSLGSSEPNLLTTFTMSNGGVVPGVTRLNLPLTFATATVTCTPLSTAE